jgi:hypothetical protein
MKIHLLPMGARFEYEGATYVKTGPQLASGPNGQRLIPKYAVLQMLGDPAALTEKKTDVPSRTAVMAAFEAFYTSCVALIPAERQAEAATAREMFLKSLE